MRSRSIEVKWCSPWVGSGSVCGSSMGPATEHPQHLVLLAALEGGRCCILSRRAEPEHGAGGLSQGASLLTLTVWLPSSPHAWGAGGVCCACPSPCLAQQYPCCQCMVSHVCRGVSCQEPLSGFADTLKADLHVCTSCNVCCLLYNWQILALLLHCTLPQSFVVPGLVSLVEGSCRRCHGCFLVPLRWHWWSARVPPGSWPPFRGPHHACVALPGEHVVVTAWAPAERVREAQGQFLDPDPGHLQAFPEITMLLLPGGTFKVLFWTAQVTIVLLFYFLMAVDVPMSPRAGIQGPGVWFLQLKPPLLLPSPSLGLYTGFFSAECTWVHRTQVMKQEESCQLNEHHCLMSSVSLYVISSRDAVWRHFPSFSHFLEYIFY